MAMQQLIKIAIVEDDAFFNKSIERYIATICDKQYNDKFEFKIQTFTTAKGALENLQHDWNIVILDYHLFTKDKSDKLTSEDVLLAVKANCKRCKIILLSGAVNPWKVLDLRTKGIYKYINKNTNSVKQLGSILRHTFNNEMRA